MSEWIVYGKDGLTEKCRVKNLQYEGEFMGACSLTVNISSPSPVNFELGDYMEYRGERFEINYDPSVVKQSAIETDGEGFVYESVVFNSLSDELTRCDFLDYVAYDNELHYSSLPNFSFFADNISKLAERIQVNLDRIYTGDKKWTVNVHPEYVNTLNVNIQANNNTVWDALGFVNSKFGANFIIRGRIITIGTTGVAVGNVFSYGKGNGLYKIERNAESSQKIITRLRAYGSTRNMPTDYYKNVEGGDVPNNMAVKNLMLPSFPVSTHDPYIDSDNIAELGIREGTVFFDGSGDLEEIYPTMEGMTAEDLAEAGITVNATGALDEVLSAEQITDNGVFEPAEGETSVTIPTFTITLKDVGFDINDYLSTSSATISMKDGMCGGRDFEIVSCEKSRSNYVLTCNRHYDESLDLYFPYNDYQIKGGDKFVLLNIEMPDVYIKTASERLLKAAKAYLAKNDYVRYSYTLTVDNVFMARQHDEAVKNGGKSIHDTIKEGDLIVFEDEDLGINGSVTISSLSIKEDMESSLIPEYEITLKDEKTVGSIEKIQNQITSILAGGIGSGTELNTEQLRSLIELYGSKIFLRKDKDDTAKGVITFEKQIKSKDFVQGNLMGAGWSIYKDANGNTVIETDKIVVRQELEASEIVVNQETFERGSSIYTKGGCTIIKVEEYDNYYRCYYDNENGNRYSGFKRGDQARCQRYDTSYAQIIKYYWRLVEFIGDDFVDLSKTDYDGSGIPEVGDDIAQLGNRYDKSRQSAIEISPDNGGRVVIWAGIDSYNLTEKNMIGMGVNPNTGRSYIYGYGDMYFGDRNLEKNFITYQIKDGETEPSLFIDADIRLGAGSEGLSNLEEFKDVQDSVKDLMVDFSVIKSQADREFTIWYFAPEPTLENEPAVNWTSDELKREHDQDLYFSDELARAWRFVDGQWVEITDERTLAVLKFAEEANKAAQEAKVVATEIKTYIDGVLPTELENLQKQIDGAIESYFYKYEPSFDNEPASLWDTDEKKEAHLNDTFTNLSDGRSWRWSKDGEEYKWVEITDTATVEALRKAGEAQDTADSKRRVFVDTPYTPYEIGDLWVQGGSGDILRCSVSRTKEESYVDSDWIKASKYTDDSALTTFIEGDYKKQLEELKTQIDSRAETWYQDTDPSLEWNTDELKELHIGDLWYDTTKDQSFMWNGTEWVTQGVPDDVFDKIDGKAEIFVSQPTEYNVNDLWILAEDTTLDKEYKAGTIVIATQTSNTFVASHWTKKDSYTDDTEADKANARLDSWASDGVISPLEKTALIQQKYDIQSEYAELIASAVRYEISYTSFNDAYRSATTALNKYTAKNPDNITVGDDYANIALYYTERQELKKAIDSAIKTEADNTYTIAMGAEGKAQTLTESIDDVVQNMEIIKAQTDMEYTIWYFDDEPTLSNEPAINWTTSELKELHDQDLYFSDSLGRAWRFVDGDWVEITDERSIVALREAAEANNRVSDLEYLKGAFGSDERVLSGGVVMSKVVSVANDSNVIEAFLNGSDFAEDSTHGKLILAGGIPEKSSSGSTTLESRAKEAKLRGYEDGSLYATEGHFGGDFHIGSLRRKVAPYSSSNTSLSGYTAFMPKGTYTIPALDDGDFIEYYCISLSPESRSSSLCTLYFSDTDNCVVDTTNGSSKENVSSVTYATNGGVFTVKITGFKEADTTNWVISVENPLGDFEDSFTMTTV